MRKVTFKNKVENLGTTYTGKAWAADFNEIKEVVNENADITTITMAVSADLVGNTLYFKNYLDQIIYQVDVSSILTSLGLVDLNDVEFTMPLGEGHAPVFSQLVNKFVNKKVSLDGHNHDSLYSPIDHNHNSLYAPLSHSNITSGNPHGVSYSNILGDVPFYTKSESDLKYHIKGGSYTEDFLAQTISSKKSITETLIIPTGNPLLSPGEWALTMTDNGWGGEPPIGGTVGFLDDLADVTLVAPIGDLQVLGRSSGQWANINLTIGHISGLSTSLGNVYTKSESDARYPILSYGLIPSSYLPSYVDDIIEVSTFSALPAVGETGKIYVTLDTNLTYRWSGSAYTEISKSLALGETDSTAYRGDRGKIAYDHSLITSGNPHGVSYSNITGTAPFYTKIESDANYHPKYGSNLLDFTAKKLKSETFIIPTNASPELSVGEWALVMTNNGWGGEPPAGGVVGYLDDLIDVSLSSPAVNQFLFHNGTSWINSYLTSLLVTTALGYTPYNSTNPSGYISAITGTMVQAVLTGEITSHYHDGRYYTESEINNFFSGVTAISGYNKSNWDTAYTKSHNILTLGTANGLSLSTQVLSLGLASSSTTGALSLTDWNTFNSKQTALNGTGFVKISGTTISYDNSTYLTTSSAASLYHPKNGSISLAFSALSLALAGAITGATDITASGKLTSGTLIIPTGVPSLSAGQWALTMTNNGFSGEAPVGGVVGYLDDLQDVSLSTLATNQFLQYNGFSWVNTLISGSQVITALGFTPYNSTNPNGYISGITGAMVTTALGYTPESYLNLPSTNGYLLSSTTTGVRSWVAPYSLPLATFGTRGGIQIGYTASGANLPVALSSEMAYVALTKSAIESVLTGNLTSHTHSYEAPITAGTTSQYWRGDKSWQTLNTSVVPELTNLYYTNARVKTYGDTLYTPIAHGQITSGNPHGTTFAQISSKPITLAGYGITDAISLGDTIQNTNPFGGRKLYINSLDNALAGAAKKYYVTVTKHKKVVNTVTYPKPINAGNILLPQWEDSPVIATYNGDTLFDNVYEGGISCESDEYLKVTLDFNSDRTAYFNGYPYGTYLLSYYYTLTPEKAEVRCYNGYAPHTIGYKTLSFSDYIGTNSSESYIQQCTDNLNFQRREIEFIIYGHPSHRTTLTEIEWKLVRPSFSSNTPLFTNYRENKAYFPFYFGNQTTNNIILNPNGNITATTFIGALSGNAATATKLGTATVGSTQLPFYLNAGTATAITQADLRIGLFGTTAIGTSTNPVYIAANGVPTASTSFGGVTGIGTASPLMDGTVAVGTSSLAARQDHIHPIDTSRAAVAQTMYIGTTAVAINRASGALALSGISTLAMSGALSGATTGSFSGNVSAASFTSGGNVVLHAGNYSSYALPLSGGIITGDLTISETYPTLNWLSSDNSVFRIILANGYTYLQARALASNQGTILFTGLNGEAIGGLKVTTSTGTHDIWHKGNLTNTLSNGYLPYWNGSSLVNSLISQDGYVTNIISSQTGGGLLRLISTGNESSIAYQINGGTGNVGWVTGSYNNSFFIYSWAYGSQVFNAQPNGNVGIGYTDRSEKFAVNGSGYFNTTLKISNIWEFDAGGIFYWGIGKGLLTWDNGYASVQGAVGNYLKLGVSGYAEAIRIGTNGKVSLNYGSDQSAQFAVNGKIFSADTITAASSVIAPAFDIYGTYNRLAAAETNWLYIVNYSAGNALNLKVGGLLVSGSYADYVNVPSNGIWAAGSIHSATSIKIGANWEAIPNGNDLELRYGGVMKAKLASDGTITTPKLILNGHSFTII